MKLPVDEHTAEAIYDVLVEFCRASNDSLDRNSFVRVATSGRWTEYRFGGTFGFGGKVWNNAGRFYVSYYREDENEARITAKEKANEALAKIVEEITQSEGGS